MTEAFWGWQQRFYDCPFSITEVTDIGSAFAIANLIKRNPNLHLAVNPSELKVQVRPGWHTYQSLLTVLG